MALCTPRPAPLLADTPAGRPAAAPASHGEPCMQGPRVWWVCLRCDTETGPRQVSGQVKCHFGSPGVPCEAQERTASGSRLCAPMRLLPSVFPGGSRHSRAQEGASTGRSGGGGCLGVGVVLLLTCPVLSPSGACEHVPSLTHTGGAAMLPCRPADGGGFAQPRGCEAAVRLCVCRDGEIAVRGSRTCPAARGGRQRLRGPLRR